jgi:HSP20 family protein
MTMSMRELTPDRTYAPFGWSEIYGRGNEENDPLLTLHREMNRLFGDVYRGTLRGHDVTPFGLSRPTAWPNVEVAKSDNEIKVTAELPGLEEKDVRVELSDNTLIIDGERKGVEDKNRWFSERYYGHFERRIPLNWEVEEDKAAASFRNGVLTVTLPRSAKAQQHTKRIPVHNGG